MTTVLTAADVEAAANGSRRIELDEGMVVTPLARDRAGSLDVLIIDRNGQLLASGAAPGRGQGNGSTPAPAPATSTPADHLARLRLESVVRTTARRVLLGQGMRLDLLEEVVAAVLVRLDQSAQARCSCNGQGT